MRLIATKGINAVTLASVGKGAGVSRQAVYLHFGSRAGYLLALVDFVNERQGVRGVPDAIAAAPSARAALRLLIERRATTSPELQSLISAINAAMFSDPDAEAAWTKRQSIRYRPMRALAARMKTEGLLHRRVTIDDAASLIWATLSFETWNYLVQVKGWSKEKYVRQVENMILNGL